MIQKEEGTRRADRYAIGAVLGSVGLVVFAMGGEAAFGHIEPFAAFMLALAGRRGWADGELGCMARLSQGSGTGWEYERPAPSA